MYPSCKSETSACKGGRKPCPTPQACVHPEGLRETVIWWLPVALPFVGVAVAASLAIWWGEIVAFVKAALL